MSNKNSFYYTVQELAGRLNVSENLLYKLIKQGKLHCTRIGSAIRFEKNYIQNWLENNTE